jgi:hypothetical protein
MPKAIQKFILLISVICIPTMATTFEVPALNGYREYRVKIRCVLNDSNYPDAVDEVRLPDGSRVNLSNSKTLIPEPMPSYYGIFFSPGHVGDTVLARFSSQLHWTKSESAAWVENNPDSIWADASQ